jgi:GMP synthase-like glutamine amidotransferase
VSRSLKVAILKHEEASPAGFFGVWAQARGHRLETLYVPSLERWPDPTEHELIVSLGSDCSVQRSEDAWIGAELEYLRRARAAAVPALGICFGAQILAAAAGGEVRRGAWADAAWHQVRSSEPELIPAGPWLCWHQDVFTVPPGGQELARDELGSLAFRLDSWVGVQFHPEADEAIVDGWIEGARERLIEERVDLDRVREEAAAAQPGARERALDLFDRLAPMLGGG